MDLRDKCPLCSGTSSEKFLVCEDHTVSHEKFLLVKCLGCGLHYTQNPPKEENIGKYYKSEAYVSHTSTEKGLVNKLYQQVRKHTIKRKTKLVKKHLIKEKTLLDIGAGTGHFVKACLDLQIKAIGLEPDADARANAKNIHNIELLPLSSFQKFQQIEVVTMWHVLEHVYDLKSMIKNVHASLTKSGIWIVALPNMASYDARHYKEYWAAYDVPRHLYHFQPEQMERIAIDFGFDLIETLPMKFDAYYVSLLSEKYKGKNLLKGFYRGWLSNVKAKNGNYSSQIYIFRKKSLL